MDDVDLLGQCEETASGQTEIHGAHIASDRLDSCSDVFRQSPDHVLSLFEHGLGNQTLHLRGRMRDQQLSEQLLRQQTRW
jgi:hypothetical protein